MKALVIVDKGKLELREVAKPVCGDDDIILEVKACGICGSDLGLYRGTSFRPEKVPFTVGHEFAGVIAEIGKNVDKRWRVGDRVVSDNTGHACGTCPACSRGDFVACEERETLGFAMDGGFAKYVKIPGRVLQFYKNCLWKIPENLSFQEATLGDPAANGYFAVIQQGHMLPGDVVVVYGVGALGLMSIAAASIGGASKVIAVGMHADRKTREALSRHYGATHFFASDEETDIVSTIREVAGENGVAVTIDAAGVPEVIEAAIGFTRTEGTIVRIGMNPRPFHFSFNPMCRKNISLQGHRGYNQTSWRNCLALAACGKLDLKSLITCELPLDQWDKGFQMTMTQEAAKVILIP